jgi:predicted phage-related endonuclease
MLAHVDGITDDGRVFEAKTSRFPDGWGKSGSDEVPHEYALQVQHYMAVTGFPVADIAVLIGGSDFRVFEVPADIELQNMIIEGEREFWHLVEKGEPPTPDWDRQNVADLVRKLYPGTDGTVLEATSDDIHHYRVLADAQEMAKNYTKLGELARAHLLHRMQNAVRMTFPDGMQLQRKLITRKAYTVETRTYIEARLSKIKETA